MLLDPIATLKQLVATPSVNPMGRDVSGPQYFEHQMTDCLEGIFRSLGVPYLRQPVAPKRENIVARLDGTIAPDRGGQIILLEAHQDTVPVDAMTIEPWTPEVRDGRLYGRGSCDVKGGLAAMLAAFSRLAQERPQGMPTVCIAATVNEEHGFSGAKALCQLWTAGDGITPRQPDAAVVAEPTGLNVVIAHKGALRWRCRTRGRAAHSSQPQLGENAIYRMGKVLGALERYQKDVVPALGQHPLCGRPSLSVGMISGGISVNTVPDQCTIEIDRRLLPGDEPSAALLHARRHLEAQELGFEVEHEPPLLQSLGLSTPADSPLAVRLAAVVQQVAGRSELVGVPYGTNASTFAAAGVPSVVCGPGDIAQAHTADEWISLDQLQLASEIYYYFGRNGV